MSLTSNAGPTNLKDKLWLALLPKKGDTEKLHKKLRDAIEQDHEWRIDHLVSHYTSDYSSGFMWSSISQAIQQNKPSRVVNYLIDHSITEFSQYDEANNGAFFRDLVESGPETLSTLLAHKPKLDPEHSKLLLAAAVSQNKICFDMLVDYGVQIASIKHWVKEYEDTYDFKEVSMGFGVFDEQSAELHHFYNIVKSAKKFVEEHNIDLETKPIDMEKQKAQKLSAEKLDQAKTSQTTFKQDINKQTAKKQALKLTRRPKL